MNILFLDQFSDLGGAQLCLLDLLPAVRDRGWQAHVAAPGEGALRERALALGAAYTAIHSGPFHSGGKSVADLARFSWELPLLAREIGKLEADIVYVNGPRLLPAAAIAFRGPLVFHCHSYLKQGYASALAGVSLAASDATVIANSSFVTGPLRLYVNSSRVYVVSNGCGAGPRPAQTGRRPAPRLGILGRIAPEKGQLDFVQAAKLLGSGYQYIVCGAPLFSNAPAAAYFDRVRESAAGLPVEFLGWREDINTVLSALDLLVVASAPNEGTTRVILEAYAAGVPVLATASGGIPEIISDNETGYLVPDADPAQLAERIREILGNPSALARVTANAYRAWQERYTVERYQERILSILATVGSSARA